MTVTHFKGQNLCNPGISPFGSTNGEGYFTEMSKYILPGEDQDDWNKLSGLTFNWLKWDKNAIMVAWRWNPEIQLFQLTPYFNVDGNNIYEDGKTVNVGVNQKFYFDINKSRVFISSTSGSVETKVPSKLSKKIGAIRIQPWFGGTYPAPKDVQYTLTFY